jgi:hypothetical protein
MIQHREAGLHGAAFGVFRAVNQTGETGLNHGAGAHGAGLDGDVERGAGQTIVADPLRRFAQRNYLGMRGGIAIADSAVSGARDDLIVQHYHRADWDFSAFGGCASFLQRCLHELHVMVGGWKIVIKRAHFRRIAWKPHAHFHVAIYLRSAHGGSEGEMAMAVPTEAEWGEYRADLDQRYAHDLFAGRTNDEMLPHFRKNVIERTSELRWMPEVPFQYYVLGFRDFVMAGEFGELEASDAADCFLGLVLEKLEKQPRFILPVMPQLLPAIRHVAANQASYDANESIYGSFPEKLKRIEALYRALGQL